jgi:hypothetical protein
MERGIRLTRCGREKELGRAEMENLSHQIGYYRTFMALNPLATAGEDSA